jgi:hypothetical protein
VIDWASALLTLPERSAGELARLIELQREVTATRRPGDDVEWAAAINLLGDALSERSNGCDDPVDALADLRMAVDAYQQALAATANDDERRVIYAIDLANALRRLPERSLGELDRLVELQGEITAARRARGDADLSRSVKLLGDAYRERSGWHDDPGNALADLRRALEAYGEALAVTPADHASRLAYVVDLANGLMDLPERSARELDHLIELQQEIAAAHRSEEDVEWVVAVDLLGDALLERSQRREDPEEALADLLRAVDAYEQAVAATPVDHDRRLMYVIETAAALRRLPERSPAALDRLIELQQEVAATLRSKGDDDVAVGLDLLGDALLERSERRGDPGEALGDLRLAIEAYEEAVEATPDDHETRLTYVIDLANGLMSLPERSLRELDRLIELQREITAKRRDRGDAGWPGSITLLGNALWERSQVRDDPGEALADLRQAVDAYEEAVEATPRGHEQRLFHTIDLANGLMELPERSAIELDRLIELQAEIAATRRARGDAEWSGSVNLLGDAYRERSERREDPGDGLADLRRAVEAYERALGATPRDHERRLMFAIDLANALRMLPERSAGELDRLIELQGEIAATRRARGDEGWSESVNLLGDAHRDRSERREDPGEGLADLRRAVEAYEEAVAATPVGHERRLLYAIDLANALIALPERSPGELDRLIELQQEITTGRRDRGDADWTGSLKLLGDAHRERAEMSDAVATRLEALDLAVSCYDEALQFTPPGHDRHLAIAVDASTAMVTRAAISKAGGDQALVQAIDVVASALALHTADFDPLRRLLPVVASALRRRGSWPD